MAIAYMQSGRFQANFDRISKSTSTTVNVSDGTIPGDVNSPFSPAETTMSKSDFKLDSKGNPIAVSKSPLSVNMTFDVNKMNVWGIKVSDEAKHETEHAVQIDKDPIGVAQKSVSGDTNGIEHEANEAAKDSTPGSSVTFGEAMDHVMEALGVTQADLNPDIQTTSVELDYTIGEDQNANTPPSSQHN